MGSVPPALSHSSPQSTPAPSVCPVSEPGSKETLQGLPGDVSHGHPTQLRVCNQHLLPSHRNLSAIQDREICCYSISCKEKDNIGECCGLGSQWG